MSTDLKLSKAQTSKIIQPEGLLGSILSKLTGPLMKVSVPLAKNSCFSHWCRNSKKKKKKYMVLGQRL